MGYVLEQRCREIPKETALTYVLALHLTNLLQAGLQEE